MRRTALLVVLVAAPLLAQEAPTPAPAWWWREKIEIRANYRDSHEQKFPLRFPFPPEFLPVGQTQGFLETVNQGQHGELSVAQFKGDVGYGNLFTAHTQFHVQDKYRRNPTSEDRKFDAEELWLRFGQKPEFLDRPDRTSFFVQLGKAPKMERQPTRLLESYGLAATAFNRMEDVQALIGGSIGRNFYWRLQGANGNPLYFRDSNALAGDNGIKELLQPHPDPHLKSGFPILYNKEVEDYFFQTDHFQFGQGLGYRWQNAAQTFGYDAIVFHYRRTLGGEVSLPNTIYHADLGLLEGFGGISLPVRGNTKEETGMRIYSEWRGLTAIGQYTKQNMAGLYRAGYELETGYRILSSFGPSIGGESALQWIQPAVRVSGLYNWFRGPRNFVDPSVWWNWVKIDYGVRIGFAKNIDLTAERTKHNIAIPFKLNLGETLVTLRVRV